MAPSYQTCRSCGQRFNNTHKPKLLPCGHCLCHLCLDKIKDNSLKSCFEPSCKKNYRNHDIQRFPTVFKLMEYSDPNASETASTCDTYRSCDVCTNEFDSAEQEPLVLPACGHVICRSCIHEISAQDNRKCPRCKTSWSGELTELRVVRDLITPAANITRMRNLPSASGGPSSNIQRRGNNTSNDNPDPKKIQFFVKNMAGNGRPVTFEMSMTATVDQLKLQIQRQWSISPTEQSLLFEHNYLQDGQRTLTSYNIRSGSEISLTCRLRGG